VRLRLLAFGAALSIAACGDDSAGTGSPAPDAGIPDAHADDAAGSDTAPDRDALDPDGADAAEDAPDAVPDTSPDAAPDGTDAAPDVGPPPPWCEGATSHLYAPFAAEEADFFPDGLLLRDDPESPTGVRVEVTEVTTPWLADASPFVQEVARALNVLSGFGALGGALVRFSAPVGPPPADGTASLTDPGWIWADLGTEPPTRIPFDARVFDDGATVVLWPLAPLRLGTEHAIVVTTEALDGSGSCIAPAPATRSLLFGNADEGALNERFERARPAYRDAVARLGLAPEQVSAISVFTTHDDLGPVRRAAAVMHEAPVAWGDTVTCTPRERIIQCDTTTTMLDMRDEQGLVDDTVTPVEYEVPVMIWLPAEREGPVPVLLFGHGMQSDRRGGWEVASRLQDDAVAVVSMPAVEHGEHPTVLPDDDPQSLFRFLAIDISTLTIEGMVLRGNFNQTNLERLRLVHLLRTQPDFDGDGIDDIDPTRVGYIGASLGAVLGPGLLALSPDLDAAVLTIGGGRLLSIVRDQTAIPEQLSVLADAIVGEGQFDRLLPLAQHAVDPADPAVWAPHVLRDRFDDRVPPSVLMAVGLEDELFSQDSGATLARALGVPHVGPVAAPFAMVDDGGDAPIVGNAADGTRTVGLFQYDRVTRGSPPSPRRPGHEDSARSHESGAQIRAFFEAWAAGDPPEIIDPFVLLDTPPRPEDW
jgi:hypothetical protein